MKRIILILFLFSSLAAFSTHQRAGEITYTHISGLTYRFSLVTYTYTPSPADRPTLDMVWGDGSMSTVQRIEKIDLPGDISKNTYIANHTFPAPGTYTVSMEDPNRNYGVINIPNSVNIPFYLKTTLVINPFLGENSSPVLLNQPIDNGCVNVPFYHNPGAYDPDGDSLSYKLVSCLGLNGEVVPGYSLPLASSSIAIDPITGDLYWDSPILQGEYNIAILIEEWRSGILIGTVLRDMQVYIGACNNQPPLITALSDTCIVAGNSLNALVSAFDSDGDKITLTGTGGPLNIANSPAVFPQPVSGFGYVQSQLTWNTNCSHVRKQPYQFNFKAKDNGTPINLVSMKSMRVTVIAPAPENVIVEPLGNSIVVSWNKHQCSNSNGYKVYRHNGPSGWVHDYCETGVPNYTGFQYVGGTNSINDTTIIDNNNGLGLNYGNQYCYVVIATFPDFAESYASEEVCTSLLKDVPIITNVSVIETDATIGKMYIAWSKPTEINTIQFPGPYEYILQKSNILNGTYTSIATFNNLNDTIFVEDNTNTSSHAWFYRVELHNRTPNNDFHIGTSNPAGSVFINLQANDQRISISWNEYVPWTNEAYSIFRKSPLETQFDSIGTTSVRSFSDFPLENGEEYCYYVRSTGDYSIDGIASPLTNFSQIRCATPIDNEPPCRPILTATTDCIKNTLTWTLPADSCLSDIMGYYIYYNTSGDGQFSVLDSTSNQINSYEITQFDILAGCYSVVAVDSAWNLSSLSNFACIDLEECNPYELPNIFTPNGDGSNDYFRPFPYDFVEKIKIIIYNRWGVVVYTSENPDIMWDGKDKFSGQNCAEGVYYYICDVYEYRIGGIKHRVLSGSVTLLR